VEGGRGSRGKYMDKRGEEEEIELLSPKWYMKIRFPKICQRCTKRYFIFLVGKNEKIKSNINGVMSIRGSLAVCFDDFKQLFCFNLNSSSLTDTLLFNDYTILVRFGAKDDVNKELWVFCLLMYRKGWTAVMYML